MDDDSQGYCLADSELFTDEESGYRYLIWQPQKICIILGNSNCAEEALFLDNARQDKVVIVKRPSGGQAVVLSPKMVIVSALQNSQHQLSSNQYFAIYNSRIIRALSGLSVNNLGCSGISDITIGDKKIAGASMYRNRRRVFFHAVVNVCESVQLLERYLRQPAIAPEYRCGRSHLDFVTSLAAQGFSLSPLAIRKAIAMEMTLPPIAPLS